MATSIASIDAQISTLTSAISTLNTDITYKQKVYDSNAAKIPALKSKYDLANARYLYVKAKAQKAGNKKKDYQCYDNQYLFPNSGACYDRDHWNKQWNYFLAEAQKAATAMNVHKANTAALLTPLNEAKGMRDDKVVERDNAIAAKNALVKAEADAAASAAAGQAMNNPDIVNATLAAETARKEAELASNRKLFIYGMATLAFVVVAVVIVRAMK